MAEEGPLKICSHIRAMKTLARNCQKSLFSEFWKLIKHTQKMSSVS